MKKNKYRSIIFIHVVVSALSGCGGGGGGGGSSPPPPPPPPTPVAQCVAPSTLATFTVNSGSVRVSWAQNLETRVNVASGGYKILISTVEGFAADPTTSYATATSPISSPITTPVQVEVNSPTTFFVMNYSAGVYYIKVYAFGEFNVGNRTYSQTSQQIRVTVQ